MCGIAGAVAIGGVCEPAAVERQLRLLDHRGPDSWGVATKPEAVIGQTRLAIIDLVTGDPPISDEAGLVDVALNGEIYNYRSLREALREDGHAFSTVGDTEVIAHLAEELEPAEVARRLEGMFAFAVWDERRKRLVLGRDRMGKKPLYYWSGNGRLVFGSEIKAVLAHPWVSRQLDADAIPAYLTFGYVPTPRTFFAGVRSVPPGHVLTLDGTGCLQVEPYWESVPAHPGASSRLDLSLDDAASQVRGLLTAAVERRLVADVPLGAFLSGGVDSSAIVGIMAGLSSRPVDTFTIGFDDEEGFDERPYARLVAERFGTDHTEFVIKPDAVDLIERLVWHHDQPFGDSSAIPTFLLSELTRGHVTVALCGDGGDELFAGYERFAAAILLDRLRRLPPVVTNTACRAASAIPGGISRGPAVMLRRFMAKAGLGVPDAFLEWVSFVPADCRLMLTGTASEWGIDDYHRIWEESEGAPLLDRLLDLTARTYLLDDLLPKVDRMSMAHGLEVRSPFLDRELLEFASRLPAPLKLRGVSGKRVLKRAVRDLLPPTVLRRRKRGFGVPLDRWFRSDLADYLGATIGAPDARVRAYLKGSAVDGLLDEHREGTANRGHALWTLLTLEVFLRREGW